MRRRKEKHGNTVLEGDALTIGAAIGIFYPVNSILITTDNVNPGTRLPGTTWVAWGAGRAVVGVGSNGTNSYVAEQTFGADAVTLTDTQSGVAAHTHTGGPYAGYTSGFNTNHSHDMSGNKGFYVSGSQGTATVNSDALSMGAATNRANNNANIVSGATAAANVDHVHIVGGVNGGATNAAAAHENRQSSIATYLWKRTA